MVGKVRNPITQEGAVIIVHAHHLSVLPKTHQTAVLAIFLSTFFSLVQGDITGYDLSIRDHVSCYVEVLQCFGS